MRLTTSNHLVRGGVDEQATAHVDRVVERNALLLDIVGVQLSRDRDATDPRRHIGARAGGLDQVGCCGDPRATGKRWPAACAAQMLRPDAERDGAFRKPFKTAGALVRQLQHFTALEQDRDNLVTPYKFCRNEIDGRRTEKARDEARRRSFEQFERRTLLLNAAIAQQHDPVGESHGLDLVVRHVDHGGGELLCSRFISPRISSRSLASRLDRGSSNRKSCACRTIARPMRHALTLTARELSREALQKGGNAEHARRVVDPLVDLVLGDFARPQPEGDIVVDRQIRIQRVVLKDHGDIAVARPHVIDHLPADRDRAAIRFSRPAMVRRSVLLPHPDGPTKTVNSPSAMSRSMPLQRMDGAIVLCSPEILTSATRFSLPFDRAERDAAHEIALHQRDGDEDRKVPSTDIAAIFDQKLDCPPK